MSTITFARPRESVWGAYASLFGGIGLFAMIFVLLAIRLATERPEQDSSGAVGGMSAAIGVPAVFLILAGIRSLRGPRQVRLEDDAVAIDWPSRQQRIAWRDLAAATARTRATTLGQDERVLHLVGHDGGDLAVLPARLERFDALADEIRTRLAGIDRWMPWQHPAAMEADVDAFDAAEAKGRQFKVARDVADDRRSRRRGMIAAAGIALMFGAGTLWGAYEMWKNHRFATADGATVEGHVERAWMLRQTPWLRYSFTDERGAPFARETSAKQDAWLAAQVTPTVPVEYLRSDPAWNRLKAGEQAEPFSVGLLAACAAFCLFGGAMLVFLGLGLDFKVGEGEPGGRLTRHGRAIWRSKANAAFAAGLPRGG